MEGSPKPQELDLMTEFIEGKGRRNTNEIRRPEESDPNDLLAEEEIEGTEALLRNNQDRERDLISGQSVQVILRLTSPLLIHHISIKEQAFRIQKGKLSLSEN